jgi:hypothetical protein
MQSALVFAEVYRSFDNISLSTTITVSLFKGGSEMISNSMTVELPMLSIPQSPRWYVTSIQGLPAIGWSWNMRTRASHVDHSLLVDGANVAI